MYILVSLRNTGIGVTQLHLASVYIRQNELSIAGKRNECIGEWVVERSIQCSTERATIPFVMMNDSMVRCLLLLLWFGWWFQISFDGFWPKYPLFPLWWHTRGWDNQHSIPSLLWWVLSSVGFLPSPSILECHYTSGNAVTIVCMYIYIWSDHGKIKRYSIAMMYWLYE